ncbi:MAG TPA: FixH family protein [Polaromonas sp.]|uniref:FixH family protein n=1 Tax=Polaromonas sp. TaxID=1869339 RepID=UPI002D3525EE|nr:FixH family protein [Polaromonas sp.]HYW58045.1 FixH family protein [Polaromonas sp.]
MHSLQEIEVPHPGARPWWKEPYVWMVISGPLSAVLACAVTAVFIFRGPDAVVPEDNYQAGVEIRRELEAAPPPLQPAQMGRNHSATGGRTYEKP